MKQKRFKWLRRTVAPVIVLALLLFGLHNLQAVTDYIRLRGYEPPAEIAALADETTMTDTARKLFYVNHPVIADRSTFRDVCSNHDEQTIVLGCYHSADRGIYLFDVEDARLNGVEHVTAAHEMLHAAYDRLSSEERQDIDAKLRKFYDTQVLDTRIRSTMAAYERTEPDHIANEMHSIFSTEIEQLTPELEEYFSRYFKDRMQVVKYANQYQHEFTSRENQVRDYDVRLAALKNTINDNTAMLKNQEAAIESLQQQMENYRAEGNAEAYNQQVPVFNQRVDRYNELVRVTQQSIAEYNHLVEERNKLALQVRELTESISSQFDTIE